MYLCHPCDTNREVNWFTISTWIALHPCARPTIVGISVFLFFPPLTAYAYISTGRKPVLNSEVRLPN